MPASRLKSAIAQVLKDEGYIAGFSTAEEDGKPVLTIALKYYEGRPVIEMIQRSSRPGLRLYKGKDGYPEHPERTGYRHRFDFQGCDERSSGPCCR